MRWKPHTRSSPGSLGPGQPGNSNMADLGWPALIALAAVLAGTVVVFDAPPPIRPFVILVFLGIGPGLSLVGLLDINDLTQRLVLAIGVSLALDTIIAGLSLYAGLWSPVGVLLTLVAITLVGVGIQLRMVSTTYRAPGPDMRANESSDLRQGDFGVLAPVTTGWPPQLDAPLSVLTEAKPGRLWSETLRDANDTAEVGFDIGYVAPVGHIRWSVTWPMQGLIDVQLSEDSVAWYRLRVMELSALPADQWLEIPVGTQARFVKFVFTHPSGGGTVGSVREIELWADPSGYADPIELLPHITPTSLTPTAVREGVPCHPGPLGFSNLLLPEITT